MKIFSHNTMTYLPCQWWLRPIAWMARCQSKSLYEQHKAGCEYFDLRFAFKNRKIYFAHGIFRYKADDDISAIIAWMCMFAKGVRVILEVDNNEEDEFAFQSVCKFMEQANIPIYGGYRKSDNKVIYKCKLDVPHIISEYSSDTAWCKWLPWLDDLCPWLYAHFHNEKTMEKYKDSDELVMIDFI